MSVALDNPAPAVTRSIWRRLDPTDVLMELVLIAICVVLTFTAPNFCTWGNFLNVLRSVSMQGVIAFGMTMVIISREIDLSVGAMVAFSGCLTAWLAQAHVPVPVAILLAVLAGFTLGAFIGVMRTRFQIPSFITSLALYTALQGGALMVTGGFPITPFPEWYSFLGGGYLAGIPMPAIVFLLAFVIIHFLMNHTSFGRCVYAVGGNPEAARLAGINVPAVRVIVLGLTSALAALSGVMLSSRMMSGTPTVAQGWELEIIAAVIIGGTSFNGGIGKVWGTLVGVVFIGVIINGMTLLNVPVYTQYVIRGALILGAVLINQLRAERTS